MIENGADVNAPNKDGETPLTIALDMGYDEIFQHLESINAADFRQSEEFDATGNNTSHRLTPAGKFKDQMNEALHRTTTNRQSRGAASEDNNQSSNNVSGNISKKK